MRSLLAAGCSAVISLLVLTPAAHAQDAPPRPSASSQDQDIVVADLLKEEAIIVIRGEQSRRNGAPLSGVGLGAGAIERQRIDSLDALAIAVPGLSMINDQDPGTNIVSLRGVTTDRLQQAAIAYVLDDVPLADTEFFTAPLFDLSRVQVLRGPQGALYGKSAAGGAIEIQTRNAFSDVGYVSATIGDANLREAEAAASLDLDAGWRLRAAGQWRAADGWIKNQTLRRTVDAEESRALRLRAAGPLWGGDLSLAAFAMEEDGGAAWASSGNVTGQFGGKLSRAALTDPIGDYEGRAWRGWSQASARFQSEIAPNVSMTLLAAHDLYRKRWSEELDYRPGPLTFFGAPIFPDGLQPIRQPTDIDATTAEVRVTHTDIRVGDGAATLRYGVFGQRVDRSRVDDFGPLLFGAAPSRYTTKADQIAAYLGASLSFGDWLWQGDLRIDRDDRRQVIVQSQTGALVEERSADFTRVQPRLAASAQIADGVYAYANYGEGFRSGGFNPRPSLTSIWRAEFSPEVTRSVEAGVKVDGVAWRAEISVFSSRIKNYQNYTFLDGQSVTLSVDDVRVDGGEATLASEPFSLLGGDVSLAASGAYADARIGRYLGPDPFIAGTNRNYSGKRVPNAPLWSGAVSADWRTQLGDFQATLGTTLNLTGETVFEIDNALRAPSKAWLDLRAGLEMGDVRIGLLARNLTDERWAVSAFGQGMLPLLAGLGPNGPFDTFTLNRGRQVSLQITRTF